MGVGVVGFCFGVVLDHIHDTTIEAATNESHLTAAASLRRYVSAEDLGAKRQADLVKQERRSLVQCLIGLVILLVAGTVIIYVDGGKVVGDPDARVNVAQAFYFACITVTTIG